MSSHYTNNFADILNFRIDQHANEVEDEEGPEETEQMHTKLVSHRQLIPTYAPSNSSFDSSEVVDVLSIVKADTVCLSFDAFRLA